MSSTEICVVYHSKKMLLTLDLNMLLEVLLDEYGDVLRLAFAPMTETERAASEDDTGLIPLVKVRFQVREVRAGEPTLRRDDLEERIVRMGRK